MDVWTPNVGDENLYLEPEDGNAYDKNAMVVITDEKTGGQRYWKTCESWCWLRSRDSCKF